jgi:hypothetical protein
VLDRTLDLIVLGDIHQEWMHVVDPSEQPRFGPHILLAVAPGKHHEPSVALREAGGRRRRPHGELVAEPRVAPRDDNGVL